MDDRTANSYQMFKEQITPIYHKPVLTAEKVDTFPQIMEWD